MATSQYLSGRKKYQRPQAILFAEELELVEDNVFLPAGFEIGAQNPEGTPEELRNKFIILSDDNRGKLDFKSIRIEKRERMVNGKMRSYHIADKRSLSVSWSMLPSRSFSSNPDFVLSSGTSNKYLSGSPAQADISYTTDGGAGGAEILDWYENHKGSFFVFLAYDKPSSLKDNSNKYSHLAQYNEVVEMFITDFSYSVVKRGSTNHDFWDISISLEEA